MKGLIEAVFLMCLGACSADKFNVSNVLDKMLQGYDKRIRPNWGGAADEIGTTMYFISIFDINTKDESMRADFYFRHLWMDHRLAFEAPPGINTIDVGPEAAKNFWEPDTFFPEGQVKFSHDGNLFFRINRDGSVLRSVRVLLKTKLYMDLTYFPHDRQIVSLPIESYGYSEKDLTYKWAKGSASVGMRTNAGTAEIAVENFALSKKSDSLSTGNYTRLIVDLELVRRSGYYVRHFYLPAILVFLFTCVSFWVTPAQTITRILLILVSFLVENCLLTQLWHIIPPVDYSTRLEKFITFGLIMSAVAVAECATVVFLERRNGKPSIFESDLERSLLDGDPKPKVKKPQDEGEQESKPTGSYIHRSARYILTIHQHRRSHEKVDLLFKVLFPIIYIIFNMWYWMSFP